MNNPFFSGPIEESPAAGEENETPPQASAAEPQFGLLDVIEAFTAMRHEWRTQTKENRELAESVQHSAELLQRIDSTLGAKLAATPDDRTIKNLLGLIIDLDISLQRAVTATANYSVEAENQQTALADSIRQSYRQSGFLGRRFGRKFFQNVIDSLLASTERKPDPAGEGVRLVLSRLRRMMDEQGLKRVETLGEIFEGETMQAISTISSPQYGAGQVAEEISPAYFYRGQLIRFAEVHVAQ